jgi:hypothetical protein
VTCRFEQTIGHNPCTTLSRSTVGSVSSFFGLLLQTTLPRLCKYYSRQTKTATFQDQQYILFFFSKNIFKMYTLHSSYTINMYYLFRATFQNQQKVCRYFFFQNLHVTPFIYKYSTITNYCYRIIKLIHDMFVLNYRNYHCHPDNMFHVTRFYRQQSPIREFQF